MMARVSSELGEASGAALLAHEGLNPRRELRLADELPRAGDAHEAEGARGGGVLLREGFEDGDKLLVLGLLEVLGERLLAVVGSLREHVAELFRTQRFLGVEEDGLDDGFEFHASSSAG